MTVAIVTFDGEKKTHLFKDPVQLINFYDSVKDKGFPVFAVNRKKCTRQNPGHKIKDGHKWCPYCGDDRRFIYNPDLDVKQCEICDVSDNEFFVRNFNGEN